MTRVLVAVLAIIASAATVARPLADDEKRLIGQTIVDYLKQGTISIEWTPFVEDFSRNPAENRIYCATLKSNGKSLPFMVKIVEEIDYRIIAVQPEHVYVVKPKDFTQKLNNTATMQFCGDAGYAVSEP